ncbi:MAG: DNA polymerase III subunit alpha, partial [Selenomonadaceae bacterium]|nr:DNA polymerase III subunit alpha [Selenomonadaceae bacterium]
IFGRENFFLEIQDHGLDEEKIISKKLIKLSKIYNIDLVVTNNVNYINREDSRSQEILKCIQTNEIFSYNRMNFKSDEYYLKSPDEMRKIFADYQIAADNTIKIADRCNVEIDFGKILIPKFKLPSQYNNAADYLKILCKNEIVNRYGVENEEINNRLNYELNLIHEMNFDDYFLIVADFVAYAKTQKIIVGPGRGSAAGSIVAYLLGITEIDPLKYNLLFERFLNPERVTMPDIDIDFCYIRRGEVINYVKKLYGNYNVAQIITFGTLAAKAVIRDVGRVLNFPLDEINKITKMIPNESKITIDKALELSKPLNDLYKNNLRVKNLIDIARELEGLPRHVSTHAAGVVISPEPLPNFVPIQLSDENLITQYDKDAIEELGLLKMDFLGLKTLTAISYAVKMIEKSRGKLIDLSKIPLDDPKTAKLLSDGKTCAVFQMESSGITKITRELQIKCFEDLIPLLALYRPGPLGSGMVDDFINRKHGKRKISYLHPKLKSILKETFGVIVYQEQVMRIVQTLAGFTLGQADILRRAISKKKSEILIDQKNNFINGCLKNDIEKNLAEKIFDLLLKFAGYGFNKSHSAAYAMLTWRTAYLKANYPVEFIAGMMNAFIDTEKYFDYVEFAKRAKIKIIEPDINSSCAEFSVQGKNICLGFSAIKNLGEKMIENIVEVRDSGGEFKSVFDFVCRVDHKVVSKKAIESLIKSGAFDRLDNRRRELTSELDSLVAAGIKNQNDQASGQINLFN